MSRYTGTSPVALLAALFSVLVSTAPAEAGEGRAAGLRPWISLRFPGLDWVETGTLADWLVKEREPALALLDARTEEEFAISHLRGAVRVDPDEDALDPLDLPRNTPVVVYCSVGYRSGAVAARLAASGFERVYNLEGGIFQWANEGRVVVRGEAAVKVVHPYSRTWGRYLDEELRSER